MTATEDPRKDRGQIHLGDLARALKCLGWQDDEQAKAIAACLGFGLLATPKPRAPNEIYDRQRYPSHEPPVSQPPPRRVFVPPAPEPPAVLPAHALPSALQPLTERAPAALADSDWLGDEDALFAERSETEIARRSLLPERTSRHIVSSALATLRVGQEIDIPKLIQAIGRRQIMVELPHRPDATLERGCQLLLDYGATMIPFWEDLSDLVRQVTDVVGQANIQAYSFDTLPTEAMHWTIDGERLPWQPDGRPVLIATDFGIQGKSGRVPLNPAWLTFIERCDTAGSPLVILIPWPEQRWPADIGGYPHLVHWSPHTSAAMVKRKIGPGHRVALKPVS